MHSLAKRNVATFFACMIPVCHGAIDELVKERDSLRKSVWSNEVEAQEHEEYFIRLWDSLRSEAYSIDVFRKHIFEKLLLPQSGERKELEYGIGVQTLKSGVEELTHAAWIEWIVDKSTAGFTLTQCEWHHSAFRRDENGIAHSTVSMTLHAEDKSRQARYAITGKLKVEWQPTRNADGIYEPRVIAAPDLELMQRQGAPLYEEAITLDIPPQKSSVVLVNDLDYDGYSEITLPDTNTILWNLGSERFGAKPLHEVPLASSDTAVYGDFTGDGITDLLSVGMARLEKGGDLVEGIFLYRGKARGAFVDNAIQLKFDQDVVLQGPPCLTTGDVDGDGDLDLWIAQYKELYLQGSMPTPYFDAKDGYPAYLLLNQGDGINFVDATELSGIKEKRNRRTYSSSLYDCDGDQDLDLLVVSDFSGLDLYINDGTGKFTDVTESSFDDRYLFGMGHSIADFNRDGLLDIYAIGMSSTTARRLDEMNAGRAEFPERNRLRSSMGYGNRLLLAQASGGFKHAENRDDYARTGWSWGVGSLDVDNDGHLESYVANGHYSNESARDYCSAYWTDDIYRGSSEKNPILSSYFNIGISSMRKGDVSWNGFEHNVLLMPMSDGKTRNVSFLFGLAQEYDSRQVAIDDLNNDGKLDIILTRYPPSFDKEKDSSILSVYMNRLPSSGNWIGVRLGNVPGTPLPEGAVIKVVSGEVERIETIITGDSHQVQHATVKHFGLGAIDQVDSIEVIWANGQRKRIENPKLNAYHAIAL